MRWMVVVDQQARGTIVWLEGREGWAVPPPIRIKPYMLSEDTLTRYAALTLLPTKRGIRSTTEIEDLGVVESYPNRTRYRIDIDEEEAMNIKAMVDK